MLDRSSCRRAKRRLCPLQLPAQFVIVFDPVTHAAQFIDVKGEPTRERQNLSIVVQQGACRPEGRRNAARAAAPRAREPHRLRVLPGVGIARDAMHACSAAPGVPHREAAADQPDVPRPLPRRTFDVDQRLKITSLTFGFTDLKGSTQLYERVGDLAAYDLVRSHFRVLHVSSHPMRERW